MPYKDRDKRLAAKKRWREKRKARIATATTVMPAGLGVAKMYARDEKDHFIAVLQFAISGNEYLCASDKSPIPLLKICIEFNYRTWAKAHPELAETWPPR